MIATRDTVASRERRLVQTFVALTDTSVEDFDAVEFFSALTERVVQLGFASEAGILLVDEAGDLQFTAASRERTHLLELFQVQNEQGPCQDCFTTGVPVSVDDLEAAGQPGSRVTRDLPSQAAGRGCCAWAQRRSAASSRSRAPQLPRPPPCVRLHPVEPSLGSGHTGRETRRDRVTRVSDRARR